MTALRHYKVMIAMCCILLVIGISVPVGVAIWYTRSQEQNACQALEYIVHNGNIANQRALAAFRYWADSDNCHYTP